MSQAYISQIMAFGYNFATKNWAFCNGQTLGIAQNQALFSLLGTTYGGNGVTTFLLPNLQSRVPIGFGNSSTGGGQYALGQASGSEQVTLTFAQMPQHNHLLQGTNDNANSLFPQNNSLLGKNNAGNAFYANSAPPVPLNPATVSMTGSNAPHPNIQPYLALNWCICLFGVFPSRN